jgi:hypothetical protein
MMPGIRVRPPASMTSSAPPPTSPIVAIRELLTATSGAAWIPP